MAAHANSRPAKSTAPIVIRHALPTETGLSAKDLLRLIPLALLSAVFNVGLLGLLFLVPSPGSAGDKTVAVTDQMDVKAPEEQRTKDDPPPIATSDQDDEADKSLADDDITFNTKRIAEKSAPGEVRPDDPVGMESARDNPSDAIAAPSGFGTGQGGGLEAIGVGESGVKGLTAGGYNGGTGKRLAGSFYGRSGATKKDALKDGGGTTESEAAVARGLEWIVRHQLPDGRWTLNNFRCNCGGRGTHQNDIAATAFGLLPLLGAGHTHKPKDAKEANSQKYSRSVLAGLTYLIRKQDKRTGNFGGGTMYAHGLATIAMCEAYGLTQDKLLKRSAQAAINYIVAAQHTEGGWRYGPREAGDTSVVGWQVMALKSAQMANLNVPPAIMKRAEHYLDSVMDDASYGYGYTGKGAGITTTAVGLLCREYLQGWGPATPKMRKGVENHIMRNQPTSGTKNIYYYYYATQVLHHLGGPNWKTWNEKMREELIRTQDLGQDPAKVHQKGSWAPEGDQWGSVGGRLMTTSLSLCTLEVYYRHLPLYRQDMVDKKELAAK